MRVDRSLDANDFMGVVEGFLVAREAEHNLLLGILAELCAHDASDLDTEPHLAMVRAGNAVQLVAVRTPPHGLVLSLASSLESVDRLADELAGTMPGLPGVMGPTDVVRRFVAQWHAVTRTSPSVRMATRGFRASTVRMPHGVPGDLRPATMADRDLIVRWGRAFHAEALDEERPNGDQWADTMVAGRGSRGLVLWEDGGRPVSMAGYGGPTRSGMRIFAVYTPPELRGRGYASACVAALTDRLLTGGRAFCFLFADLANPASNSIYRRIGYEPVIDFEQWDLFAGDAPKAGDDRIRYPDGYDV